MFIKVIQQKIKDTLQISINTYFIALSSNLPIKTISHKPFKDLNETERSTQLTIHQESTHNPQARGHGFERRDREREK